jgi:hypothetical protein
MGQRVAEVKATGDFYQGLGLDEVGRVPDPDGRPVFTIPDRGEERLLVGTLQGMPVPGPERERRIQQGPRDLEPAAGLAATTLDARIGERS